MLSVGFCTGGMANRDIVRGARRGVDTSGPSLGLAMAGLGLKKTVHWNWRFITLGIFLMTLHATWRWLLRCSRNETAMGGGEVMRATYTFDIGHRLTLHCNGTLDSGHCLILH